MIHRTTRLTYSAPQTSDTIPSDLLSLVPQQRMYAPHPIGLAPAS